VHPNHHRFALLPSLRLGPDIQRQTVLADRQSRIANVLKYLAPDIGDAVLLGKVLGVVGTPGADVGGDAGEALRFRLSAQATCIEYLGGMYLGG
jgi:hypothetical protein